MYTNILTVLRCPHCGARFQLTESKKEGEENTAQRLPAGGVIHKCPILW